MLKEFLLSMQRRSAEEQHAHKREILEAVDDLLAGNPTEEEFSRYMAGIVLMPEVLFRCLKWEELQGQ